MKLRNRLFAAFFIIILLPCSMIGTIGSVILTQQVRSMEETYRVETDGWEVVTEPVQILNRMTKTAFNELSAMAQQHPEQFNNTETMTTVNNSLLESYSYLLVEKNNEMIFVGNQFHYGNIKRLVPDVGGFEVAYDGGVYVGGDVPFLVKQQDFSFADGVSGSFYIITDVNAMVLRLKSAATIVIFGSIITIVFTAGILVAWLYQGILKPLNALRKATRQMQEGNLDYSLKDNISDDEIGQLCADFEEMRVHLKKEIEVRIQYEQDLRELISNISHDIKTPLTAIKGYAEGLLDGVADTPERREKYLRTIFAKASDMTTLVDELSFYTKIDTNNIPYHFEKVKVNDYFRDCIEDNSPELEIVNVELSFETDVAEEVYVLGDREQLRRVMSNLIGNAVKYRGDKEKGIIRIRLKDEGNLIRVDVEDNGIGIAESALPYVFERFYRADASRNSKQGGSGLGLAIAKRIIEEHGGTIRAESKEGEGTTFSFTLKKIEIAEKKGIGING
ncbi:MAG: HAMP domain-containing histidine kinase [Lachnospiraceae bacterium]|nr:HAMP domain-containing histidine kinase [Lachnospiraceae bacterium]